MPEYRGGHISGVQIRGSSPYLIIILQPEDFLKHSEEEKFAIKNRLLLEKFKVYFKVHVYTCIQYRVDLEFGFL